MKLGRAKKHTSAGVESRVVKYLESQGYQATIKAKLRGQSGIEHTFDVLAHRDVGFTTQVIAICIVTSGDKEAEASAIFNFANKAYDTGIKDRVLIASSEVDPEIRQLAQKQRIKIIDETKIESLLPETPAKKVKPGRTFRFDTKEQLIESLINLGYRVEEGAMARGRSGVEYVFDILALGNGTKIGSSLGIDIMSGENEIGLEEVSLFDTKAYDAALGDKVIALLSTRLSPQARQFVDHQGIKILELGEKAVAEEVVVVEPEIGKALKQETKGEVDAAVKPAESKVVEATPEKTRKLLRQTADPEALKLIPEVLARRYNAIPVSIKGNTMQVAMADPTDILALEAFSVQSRMRVKPMAANVKEIREAIDFNYKGYGEIEKQVSHISVSGGALDDKLAFDTTVDTPLVQALNLIIDEAVKARASDIHIEPQERRVRVRYRIDGTLQDMMSLPLDIHSALISRVKILANMNIADHNRAQDGQFSTVAKQREIDIRVATSPTVLGEMTVLRLLDKSTATLGLSELGFLPDSLEKFEKMLKVPYGMILVSGPTGAGKTTTLYAAVNDLDTQGRNIVTIEDPAEYRFEEINQIQVNPQAGITFASGLRSILRLDPDVVLVGEIRDSETASIAVQAALTGHLLLSSIHANDTVGVLIRLIDLGVEPFLISSGVIGVVAQRMVRRICPDCTQLIEAPLVEQLAYEQEMGEKKTQFLYAAGCKTCAYTGYLGRTGLFEILGMSDSIRSMLISGVSTTEIRAQAIKEGMKSMMNDGMHKVKAGLTTPSEILRSAYSVDQKL
jgi:general secretion pathway protein E